LPCARIELDYLLLSSSESLPFPPNQSTNLTYLHVLHITRCEAIHQEVGIWSTGLFDQPLILNMTESLLRSILLGLFLQLIAGHVGCLDLSWSVLKQPLFVGSFILGPVLIRNVIQTLDDLVDDHLKKQTTLTSISSGLRLLYCTAVALACSVSFIPLPLVSRDKTVYAVEGSCLGGSSSAVCLRVLFFWPATFFTLAAFCSAVNTFRFGFGFGFGFAFDLVFRLGFLAAGFLVIAAFLGTAFFGVPAFASLRAAAGFRFDAVTRPV
jgi:hypothetical protein